MTISVLMSWAAMLHGTGSARREAARETHAESVGGNPLSTIVRFYPPTLSGRAVVPCFLHSTSASTVAIFVQLSLISSLRLRNPGFARRGQRSAAWDSSRDAGESTESTKRVASRADYQLARCSRPRAVGGD